MSSVEAFEVKARALTLPALAVIDGREVGAASGATFDNISPRDGRLLNRVAACAAADVELAVQSARRAFEDGCWRDRLPREKKARLHRLADLIEANADELALLEALDVGKPITQARNVDLSLAIRTTRYYAEAIDKLYGEVGPTGPDDLSLVVHEPLGVIAAVVPWNFPLHMAMWKAAPALAMGNSVVLKPAEQSPLTALRLGQLALEAGIPSGVLNVVPGFGETAGQALGRHMDVDMVTFTGSTAVGKLFLRYAGESNMKRVSLECGGKSPNIVFADAPDLDKAAEAAAWGIFYNSGQVCTAGSRLLVEESIKDAFLEKLIAVAGTMRLADPLDPEATLGAMVSEGQMRTALDFIDGATAEGASLRLGGRRARQDSGGFYVEPTIFEVRPDARLAREEVFGPVLAAMSFRDADEALRLANDTIYGLAAGVWTRDISRALKLAKRIRAGQLWVNGWDACDITTPFGGFKQSGFGRDRSLHALEKYADLKTIWISL